MSGKPWTAQRKEEFRRKLYRRWRDGVYAKRRPAMLSAEERARRRGRMKLLNIRMRDDDVLKGKCVRGQRRVRRSPAYRAIQSAVMKDIMARPQMRALARAHARRINKQPAVRRRQWASRRKHALQLEAAQ